MAIHYRARYIDTLDTEKPSLLMLETDYPGADIFLFTMASVAA